MFKDSLLKLWALATFTERRVSISNQSRKRVSLRGEEVPACCYLCWGSALVNECWGSDEMESREAVYTRGRFVAHTRGQWRILSTSAREEEGGESPEEATWKAAAGWVFTVELPKKKSNAPMSVKSEIVTDYKSLNYLNAPWNKNVFFRRWSRDWAWIYF